MRGKMPIGRRAALLAHAINIGLSAKIDQLGQQN